MGTKQIQTRTCANCGADDGLHHYETSQCPKDGIEEWRDGKKQQWESTVFEDSGVRKLHDAAPELLEALIEIAEGKGRYNPDKLIHASNTIEDMVELAKAAIKKATT